MLKSFPIALAGAAILLAGCSADNLYIAQKTNLGLNSSYNQAKQSGKFILGYKQQFITVIPKSAPLSAAAQKELGIPDPKDRDAMAILSCSDVKVGFLELKEYSEYLATGAAARLHARKLASVSGGGEDADAARLYAYQLRDKLSAAAKAVDDAGDATPQADIAAAQAKLNELINGPNDTLSPGLAILEATELKTVIEKLTASNTEAVKTAGTDIQFMTLQHQQAKPSTSQLDAKIFSCFRNPEKV